MQIKKLAYILVGCMLLCAAPALMAASSKKSAKPFTVVIDAGHGGKDTGAVDNNVKEKDINLGVAKELAAKIRKGMKNARVILTRDNDNFISLQGRADKANQAKADLFISIHTNSLDVSNKNRKSVAGASVYALGLHKDANNMAVARRENSVIELEKNSKQTYSGFDPSSDESYIIFEMAQKKNLSQSIRFANDVQKQLVETAGRKNRGVHQAGFWVLWATSMPAVLVELDFICNPNSAKFMASGQGQSKLADAIYKAVKKYEQNLRSTSGGKIAYEESNAVSTSGDEETVVLASSSSSSRKVSDAPDRAPSSKYATARRRRRSNASREASDRRDVASSSITVNTHPSAPKVETRSAAPAANADPGKQAAPSKTKANAKEKNKKDKGKKEKKTRMVNNRRVDVSDDSAPRPDVKAEKAKADKKTADKKKADKKKADKAKADKAKADKLKAEKEKAEKQKAEKKKADKKKVDKKSKEADRVQTEVKEAFSKPKLKSNDEKSRLNRGSLRGRNK